MKKGSDGNIYNIGSKNEFSVMEITQKLVKLIKNSDEIEDHVEFVKDRDFNDFRYSISNKKLVDLGWKELVKFDDGLSNTVEWYLNVDENHWGQSLC